MKWIKVEDKLPEYAGRYLVFHAQPLHAHTLLAWDYPHPVCCEPKIAYWTDFNWRWNTDNETECIVTHWMYLPKPPEYLQ